jgi:hypothetical protein
MEGVTAALRRFAPARLPITNQLFSPVTRMRHPFGLQQYIRVFFIVNITTYTTYSAFIRHMAPKKENTKKVAGNAKVDHTHVMKGFLRA